MRTLAPNRPSFVDATLKRDMITSLVAGQLAGLIMAVAMVLVFTFYLGKPPYFPVQVIGSLITGDVAVYGGFHLASFLAGLGLHQLGAVLFWSIPFGLIINRLEHSTLNVLALGLTIGVVSQLIDVGLVVPVLMNQAHGHNIWAQNVPNSWSWIAHLAFGVSFLLFCPVRRHLPATE